MSNRTVEVPGVFAATAATVIPSYPVPGTGYRKGDLVSADITNGFLYGNVADSATVNQLLYVLTAMMSQLSAQGLLSWCASTPYAANATAVGSDGKRYRAISANTGNDPVTSTTYWRLSQAPQALSEKLNMIRGTFNGIGSLTITKGAGFGTLVRNGTGDYTINFPAGLFSDTPSVLVNFHGSATYAEISSSATSVHFKAWRPDTSSYLDMNFDVIAIGPE